jgi:DeoR family deoxyribose operon repressor
MERKMKRINQMAKIIKERNGTTVKELSKDLAVSEMTVRRDLEQLKAANIITLVHGAAIYKKDAETNALVNNYQVVLEKAVSNPEKESIGKAAARLLAPEDTVFIDIGTTTEQLARHIPQNLPITVLCFTVNVLLEIYKKNVENLIMGGGYYHSNTQLFESNETLNLIRNTRAKKYFVSAAGISRELGLTCANQHEIGIKQACIESSQQRILLADSKKFGQSKPAYFAPLEKINTVITDTGINREWVNVLEDMGINVLLA